MRRPRRGGIAALAVLPLCLVALFVYIATDFEEQIFAGEIGAPAIDRLGEAETQRLGWHPAGLDAVLTYAGSLSSDTLMIVTAGETVVSFGDVTHPYPVHSLRKALLSALVGQHLGPGEGQIDLDATLADLGLDDSPGPLTPLQRQATVLHLLKSTSGINHAAAAEEGLLAEKNRRLGADENTPGEVWAYNNWDYNALTTIFETRTGLSIAEAFQAGLAEPLGLRDHSAAAVTYSAEPGLSRHRAAMFQMSARDLARFGEVYLAGGEFDGERILPAEWVDLITKDYTETGEPGLRQGHGYLWWIPGPESGLPSGSFWAWGFGQQALFVIPAWQTVIVHQSDTAAFLQRFLTLVEEEELTPDAALEKVALSCLEPAGAQTAFCRHDRFILRREFSRLIELIVAARL